MGNYIEKKVLIIVPHPDDEINVAGQLIVTFLQKKYEVYVVFTTNGDFNCKIGNNRIYEAIEALKVLGVEENHVIFLGYSNDWLGDDHIYNIDSIARIKCSMSGKTETNSIPEHSEYSIQKYGCHHSFLRSNFKNDLKNVILDYKADYLICNDFDSHPDHRATSLMFEEVLGEILKEQKDYRPIVLKKFAYSGVWKGPKDYYDNPRASTINTIRGKIQTDSFEMESPYYRWSERIRFSVPASTKTDLLKDNILYKAALKHKSQIAWYQILRIANDDVVYWWRPTNNLIINAIVNTSSGNKKYLTDFKLYESSNVKLGIDDLEQSKYMWIPNRKDNCPYINVLFKNTTNIRLIKIFSDYKSENHIETIKINVDNECYYFDNFLDSGPVWNIEINLKNVKSLKIYFLEWKGTLGITELEIYDHIPNFFDESELKNERYSEISEFTKTSSIKKYVEMFFLNVKLLRTYKMKEFIKRIRR